MMCGYLKNLGFIHGVAVCVRLQLFHVEVKVFLCVLEVKTEIEEATTRLLVSIRREQNPQLGAEKVPTWGQNDRV